MRPILRVIVLAANLLTACATAPDLILVNGRVYTGIPAQPWVEALAIQGDRIVSTVEIFAPHGPTVFDDSLARVEQTNPLPGPQIKTLLTLLVPLLLRLVALSSRSSMQSMNARSAG